MKRHCAICNTINLNTFIDGATTMGPWADMCETCYEKFGVGLGIGRGQKYTWNEAKGSYVQVEGGTQTGKSGFGSNYPR